MLLPESNQERSNWCSQIILPILILIRSITETLIGPLICESSCLNQPRACRHSHVSARSVQRQEPGRRLGRKHHPTTTQSAVRLSICHYTQLEGVLRMDREDTPPAMPCGVHKLQVRYTCKRGNYFNAGVSIHPFFAGIRVVGSFVSISNPCPARNTFCRRFFVDAFPPCNVRPVPLEHYIFPAGGEGLHLVVDNKGRFRENNFQVTAAFCVVAGFAP